MKTIIGALAAAWLCYAAAFCAYVIEEQRMWQMVEPKAISLFTINR